MTSTDGDDELGARREQRFAEWFELVFGGAQIAGSVLGSTGG
jgi:hypothetical protein